MSRRSRIRRSSISCVASRWCPRPAVPPARAHAPQRRGRALSVEAAHRSASAPRRRAGKGRSKAGERRIRAGEASRRRQGVVHPRAALPEPALRRAARFGHRGPYRLARRRAAPRPEGNRAVAREDHRVSRAGAHRGLAGSADLRRTRGARRCAPAAVAEGRFANECTAPREGCAIRRGLSHERPQPGGATQAGIRLTASSASLARCAPRSRTHRTSPARHHSRAALS